MEKKTKLDSLQRYGTYSSTPLREFQQYRCIGVQTDDPLSWCSQTETYKRLASVARCILAVPLPATSAPSERIFSLAGALVNARRSSLSPRVVDKTIFVHENVSVNVG